MTIWESNAILLYLAAKHPQSGLWPSDLRGQADALRWLAWESAHWDAESVGIVSFEKSSKMVIGLGAPDPAFIARGGQNFGRFAAVLDGHLTSSPWLQGDQLTIADFSVRALVPTAGRFGAAGRAFPRDSARVRTPCSPARLAGRHRCQRRRRSRRLVRQRPRLVDRASGRPLAAPR